MFNPIKPVISFADRDPAGRAYHLIIHTEKEEFEVVTTTEGVMRLVEDDTPIFFNPSRIVAIEVEFT